jgi:hypothetical protein
LAFFFNRRLGAGLEEFIIEFRRCRIHRRFLCLASYLANQLNSGEKQLVPMSGFSAINRAQKVALKVLFTGSRLTKLFP